MMTRFLLFHQTQDTTHVGVDIESNGTNKPVLELMHYGATVSYCAEGRILRTLDANAVVKPSQARFACQLQPSEGKHDSQLLTMGEGDWAHIVLADIGPRTNQDKGEPDVKRWLRIRRGSYGRYAVVEDTGVEIELRIRVTPRWALDDVIRRYQIRRDGERITVTPVEH
jgi:hypothetical protein